jgi:hypothetical protein
MRRNYYAGHPSDEGRIIPKPSDPFADKWNKMRQIEKIAWCWTATNRFIEYFKSNLSKDRLLLVKSEDLFKGEAILNVFEFIGIPLPSKKILEKLLSKPVNYQKTGTFPKYDQWLEEDKRMLRNICFQADLYGYKL